MKFPLAIFGTVALVSIGATAAVCQESAELFKYHAPGIMTHPGDKGVTDRHVYLPAITFPIRVGQSAGPGGQPLRAYANSQVFRPGGVNEPVDDPKLYVYPWFDTLCETHHAGGMMPVCPSKSPPNLHQGVDIRPNAPRDNTYDIFAVFDGKVSNVVTDPKKLTQLHVISNDGVWDCLYLHLNPTAAQGQSVKAGDIVGKVSHHMVGGTSIHLHLQCKTTHPTLKTRVNMPIYASLIAAYRRAWQLPDAIDNGLLRYDPLREIESPSITAK
jgi:murein DD-endopeptidase MepM/ murein hydrolase activator NlpD